MTKALSIQINFHDTRVQALVILKSHLLYWASESSVQTGRAGSGTSAAKVSGYVTPCAEPLRGLVKSQTG